MTELLTHVEANLHARKLLPRGQAIVVAVSGGLDSMVLLHLLRRLAPQNRWRLIVAHFNHQLRGRSSDADERFVCKTAAVLGLPFIAGRASVRARARQTGQSLEMAARELRHGFLAQAVRRSESRFIALAHHADDQVELFFLRLLRGAGGEGLAGMKWRSPSPAAARASLVRPLLDVRRTELAAFARQNKIAFREDASNAALDICRNRIRHELLPLLESRYQAGLTKAVLRSMEIIGAEADFVVDSARRWLDATRRPRFGDLPVAVQRRCVQLQLQQMAVAADYDTIEWLREKPHSPLNLSRNMFLVCNRAGLVRKQVLRQLSFRPGEKRVLLKGKAGEAVFGEVRFSWRVVSSRSSNRLPGREGIEFFDADALGNCIKLRHWRPGDRFQPIGMPAPVKLQDWFTNQKVSSERRRELIVAAAAKGEIFWVEGLRISERFKLTKSTRRRLVWRWRRA